VLTFFSCALSWLVLEQIHVTTIDVSPSFDASGQPGSLLQHPHDHL